MTIARLRPVSREPRLPELPAPPARRAPRAKRVRTYTPVGPVGARLQAAAQLQRSIAELEAQLAEHREWFLAHLKKNRLDSLEAGDFSVGIRVRHNWKYSVMTENQMLALRNLQKSEQDSGVAGDTPTVYVAFNFKQPK